MELQAGGQLGVSESQAVEPGDLHDELIASAGGGGFLRGTEGRGGGKEQGKREG
ncbi:hypothetical protein LBMAG56_14710 [Verrucomicrobiota bacterium]|nr:hypothetical protein LBMAG56_14710 [Verrucomicrobiota bacterium]